MISLAEFEDYRAVIAATVSKVSHTENLLKQVRAFQAVLEDAEENISQSYDTDEAVGGVQIMLDELTAQLEADLVILKNRANDQYRALQHQVFFDAE